MSLAKWEDEGADMSFCLSSDFQELSKCLGQVFFPCRLQLGGGGQDASSFSGSAHGQCYCFHCVSDGEANDVQFLGLFFQAVLELGFVAVAEGF